MDEAELDGLIQVARAALTDCSDEATLREHARIVLAHGYRALASRLELRATALKYRDRGWAMLPRYRPP